MHDIQVHNTLTAALTIQEYKHVKTLSIFPKRSCLYPQASNEFRYYSDYTLNSRQKKSMHGGRRHVDQINEFGTRKGDSIMLQPGVA